MSLHVPFPCSFDFVIGRVNILPNRAEAQVSWGVEVVLGFKAYAYVNFDVIYVNITAIFR